MIHEVIHCAVYQRDTSSIPFHSIYEWALNVPLVTLFFYTLSCSALHYCTVLRLLHSYPLSTPFYSLYSLHSSPLLLSPSSIPSHPRCKEVWQSGSSKGTRTMKGLRVTILELFPSESAATRTDGKYSLRYVFTSPPHSFFISSSPHQPLKLHLVWSTCLPVCVAVRLSQSHF
jgi:hypothetical protein